MREVLALNSCWAHLEKVVGRKHCGEEGAITIQGEEARDKGGKQKTTRKLSLTKRDDDQFLFAGECYCWTLSVGRNAVDCEGSWRIRKMLATKWQTKETTTKSYL